MKTCLEIIRVGLDIVRMKLEEIYLEFFALKLYWLGLHLRMIGLTREQRRDMILRDIVKRVETMRRLNPQEANTMIKEKKLEKYL